MKFHDWICLTLLLPFLIALIVFCGNVFCFMFFEPFLTEDMGARLVFGSIFFFIMFAFVGYIFYEVLNL